MFKRCLAVARLLTGLALRGIRLPFDLFSSGLTDLIDLVERGECRPDDPKESPFLRFVEVFPRSHTDLAIAAIQTPTMIAPAPEVEVFAREIAAEMRTAHVNLDELRV